MDGGQEIQGSKDHVLSIPDQTNCTCNQTRSYKYYGFSGVLLQILIIHSYPTYHAKYCIHSHQKSQNTEIIDVTYLICLVGSAGGSWTEFGLEVMSGLSAESW